LITPGYCRQFISRHIAVRTIDGAIHRGILHSVTSDGIYVRPITGARLTSNNKADNNLDVTLLQQLPESELHAQEVLFPFFFLPFLALAALWPLALWW
jgi:hypothetical protein